MPEVELRADFDRDGRLTGTAAEYAARATAPGAIVGPNLDRDGRSLPTTARVLRPLQLDFSLPTKQGSDNDPIALQIVVSAPAAAKFTTLRLLVEGENANAVDLVDGRSRLVTPQATAPGRVEFGLPTEAGRHQFSLEASRPPGSPLGKSDAALTLSVVGRDAAGTDTTVDSARLRLAGFIVCGDLAPAEVIYLAVLGDNAPALSDVREGLASTRPAVPIREVGPADNKGDGWLQDQFQVGHIVAPGRSMRAVLHLPRLRTNAQVGSSPHNLAELVRTHFPSTDLGLIDDFWQRTVPLIHAGGTAQLTFPQTYFVFRAAHMTTQTHEFLLDSIRRLCAAAASLGITPAPPECGELPPATTLPTIRAQVPVALARLESLVARLLAKAATNQRSGIEAMRNRARQRVQAVERVLGLSGQPGSEVFELEIEGTVYRLEGGNLLKIAEEVERMHDSLVYGGNIEASPPTSANPFGKVVIGEGENRLMDPPLRDFLEAGRAVQPLFQIDTAWLGVGHVDELISFLPDKEGGSGQVVMRASPEVAFALMEGASALYRSGLPWYDLDAGGSWRPLTLQRHRMNRGTHPVTRLFRGKLWLHYHPHPHASSGGGGSGGSGGYGAGGGGSSSRYDPELSEVLLPPQIYQRMVDWYGGLLGESLAPYYPEGEEDTNYYPAALSAWELSFFEGETNEEIAKEKLKGLDEVLHQELPGFPIRRVPVLFDRVEKLVDRSTAAFVPDLANLQHVNGTVLIPNPFGPRMSPDDAAQVIAEVLRNEGFGSIAGRVSVRYFQKQGLDVTQVWLNPALQGATSVPFHTLAEIAREFADGFVGASQEEIEEKIRRANRSAFDSSGELRSGWRKLTIPERTVDLFQAYTHALLDAQGLRPAWIDSWYYHIRMGEIHCGTNVLRAQPQTRVQWWTRLPQPQQGTP
ncbi:MAG: protein-arginine deiminase family protein [Solirubrobacterales bacterium]